MLLGKGSNMKTRNITFSLPESLINMLQSQVGKSKMSKFAAKAIEDAINQKQVRLEAQYAEAEQDLETQKTIAEWSLLDGEDWEE